MKPIDTSHEAEKIQIEIFRAMGPERRLQSAAFLSETCRTLLEEGIRRRHPSYTEKQVRLEVIRCLLPEDLFLRAYSGARHVLP